jgi:hypothetical protein
MMGSYRLTRGPEPQQWLAHHSDGVSVAFTWFDDSVPPCCPSKRSTLAQLTDAHEVTVESAATATGVRP